jgi:hypothetical protein
LSSEKSLIISAKLIPFPSQASMSATLMQVPAKQVRPNLISGLILISGWAAGESITNGFTMAQYQLEIDSTHPR